VIVRKNRKFCLQYSKCTQILQCNTAQNKIQIL